MRNTAVNLTAILRCNTSPNRKEIRFRIFYSPGKIIFCTMVHKEVESSNNVNQIPQVRHLCKSKKHGTQGLEER